MAALEEVNRDVRDVCAHVQTKKLQAQWTDLQHLSTQAGQQFRNHFELQVRHG